jgi:hypothetical protein
MLEGIVIEIQRQLARMEVTKLLNVVITTIGVEMVVAPNTNVVRGGILIRIVENLGHGFGIIFIGKNLNRSLEILIITTGIVGTPRWCLLI